MGWYWNERDFKFRFMYFFKTQVEHDPFHSTSEPYGGSTFLSKHACQGVVTPSRKDSTLLPFSIIFYKRFKTHTIVVVQTSYNFMIFDYRNIQFYQCFISFFKVLLWFWVKEIVNFWRFKTNFNVVWDFRIKNSHRIVPGQS